MATVTVNVTSGANDGYANTGGGSWNNGSTNWTFGSGYAAYARFNNITIPNAATITSAILKVKSNDTASGAVVVYVGCSNEDNATMPSDAGVAAGRSYAGSTSTWTTGNWNNGTTYDSPDFTSSVQAVVNRAGWASGNSLLIMLRNTGGSGSTRNGRTYENDSLGPQLVINYVSESGQPVTVRFGGTSGMRLGGPSFGRGW